MLHRALFCFDLAMHTVQRNSLFMQVKEYILQLEAHLGETHRQAQRLIKKQSELGSSLGEFGSSLLGLGKFEQPPLADQFLNMGEKSATLARNSQARTHPCRRKTFGRIDGEIFIAQTSSEVFFRVCLIAVWDHQPTFAVPVHQ